MGQGAFVGQILTTRERERKENWGNSFMLDCSSGPSSSYFPFFFLSLCRAELICPWSLLGCSLVREPHCRAFVQETARQERSWRKEKRQREHKEVEGKGRLRRRWKEGSGLESKGVVWDCFCVGLFCLGKLVFHWQRIANHFNSIQQELFFKFLFKCLWNSNSGKLLFQNAALPNINPSYLVCVCLWVKRAEEIVWRSRIINLPPLSFIIYLLPLTKSFSP